jgi:hypothetical protein
MRRIFMLVPVAVIIAAVFALMAATAFAGGGGKSHINCSTSADGIETCNTGGGQGGSDYNGGEPGGGGTGNHLTYNPETGDSSLQGGTGWGGSGSGGGRGVNCEGAIVDPDPGCVGGGSPPTASASASATASAQ